MIVKKTVILEQEDFDSLHDVILEALDKSMSNEEIQKVWESLPMQIKLDAERWGLSDTCVRDDIYTFLEKGK